MTLLNFLYTVMGILLGFAAGYVALIPIRARLTRIALHRNDLREMYRDAEDRKYVWKERAEKAEAELAALKAKKPKSKKV